MYGLKANDFEKYPFIIETSILFAPRNIIYFKTSLEISIETHQVSNSFLGNIARLFPCRTILSRSTSVFFTDCFCLNREQKSSAGVNLSIMNSGQTVHTCAILCIAKNAAFKMRSAKQPKHLLFKEKELSKWAAACLFASSCSKYIIRIILKVVYQS